ncbi:Crp/Fnr family transcriptional regulator [Novosphingobium naphthalenivorans]|uniref:Crp/Fnr family transcriptional regulator n=1 Tax=Novosphingobium naphthalenivorans TaxID=273168 RepID=UPI0008300581|nr:Crp/Fnr family transcriptional regulator [Novosphingobium naphthalenivorans]
MPFLDRLQPDTVAALTGSIRVHTFAPRTILLQPGDRVSGVYFVSEGTIRIYYVDAEGREGTLYRIERGESCVLALNSLFSSMPYPAWAEAGDEGVSCSVLEGTAARRILAEDETFMNVLFEQVSTRLYTLLQDLERAIRLPLEKRLAGLLLDLADEAGRVALPHERLANHLGTSREVVSRIIRSLTAAGVLQGRYGLTEIIDAQALRKISDMHQN